MNKFRFTFIFLSDISLKMRLFKRLNYRHIMPDLLIMAISLYASLFLRFGIEEFSPYFYIINKYVLLFLLLRIFTMISLGVYDIIWRYISINDVLKLVKSILLSTVFIICATYLVDIERLPRSTFIIDTLLLTSLLVSIRVGRRLIYVSSSSKNLKKNGKSALIYGAGTNGRTLAQRLESDSTIGCYVQGFIDDDLEKVGRLIAGVKVMGSLKDLSGLIKDFRIKELLISTRRVSGKHLREIVQMSHTAGIRPRLFMDIPDNGLSKKNLGLFKNIELADLLNRSQRNIDFKSIRNFIENQVILVTGAGGSIGSELARQILQFLPSRLLFLDHSEFNLYQIDHELRSLPPNGTVITPILLDIKDCSSLRNAFREYRPDVVFHAAAYKHVHLVEANPFSSILNNVLGTKNLIELSNEFEVESFILISTDKAVNPAGIMGATKRVCELMVAAEGKRTGRMYCAVRFGNVLGSSGSLIPMLQKQIENGEVITLTHEEMTRYFMLISEAVSLVLKAATVSRTGDIALLKMGEPIKIIDIARSLLVLMGKTEEEIPIIFTGVRPGEKMFEELYINGDELNTEHPDILVLPRSSSSSDYSALMESIEKMITAALSARKEALIELRNLVKSTSLVNTGEIRRSSDRLILGGIFPLVKEDLGPLSEQTSNM